MELQDIFGQPLSTQSDLSPSFGLGINTGTPTSSATADTTPTTTISPTGTGGTLDTTGATTGALDTGGTTGGTGSTFDRSGTISTIQERAAAANKLFNTLFKGIDKVLSENTSNLGVEQVQLQDNLSQQLQDQTDIANRQYAARGLSDSSFRNEGIARIGQEFGDLANQARKGFQGQIAGLSREAAQQKAREQATQNTIAQNLGDLTQFSDAELIDFRNQLDTTIAGRKESIAGLTTNAQELEGFDINTIVPGFTQQLQEITSAGVAPEFKAQIIAGLIQNSGLSAEQQQQLSDQFLAPLGVAV